MKPTTLKTSRPSISDFISVITASPSSSTMRESSKPTPRLYCRLPRNSSTALPCFARAGILLAGSMESTRSSELFRKPAIPSNRRKISRANTKLLLGVPASWKASSRFFAAVISKTMSHGSSGATVEFFSKRVRSMSRECLPNGSSRGCRHAC